MICLPEHVEKNSAGKCVACNRLRAAEWYKNNRQRALAARLAWARANKEKLAVARKTRRADPEKKRKSDAASRRWKDNNPERRREHCREWRAKNPDKSRVSFQNRRARLLAAEGSHTAADIADIRRSQSGKCAYCKSRLGKVMPHVDHIVPLARGGSNRRSNLQILCYSCNSRKGASDPVDFARRTGRLI